MNLSAPFINRPIMTTLIMVAILVFGGVAYKFLPISDLPNIAYPTIQVSAQNPGSDAKTMAATVATPLEQQIMIIPGLESVVSNSSQGSTTIAVTFTLKRDPDGAMTDVAAAISRAASDLPKEMPSLPQYRRYNPAATPSLFIHISSDTMTSEDMYDYANNALAERFSMVEGVSEVDIYGAKRAVRVKINPDAIAALGLSFTEVADQVFDASQVLPAGQVYDAYQNWYLEPLGELTTGEAYQRLIVRYDDDAPLRIEDIGHAITGNEYDRFMLDYWDAETGSKPSVVLAITKASGANTVEVCDTIIDMLPRIREAVPASLDIGVVYNFANLIRDSIWDVKFTLIVAFVLVVLVIFLFLGNLWSTLIPSVTLPMSILGTFMLMYINGYSLDILSMLALILVVGFLVDDAIVVLENSVRHLEMGKTPYQAALDGSAQISTTVLSMTLSLSAIFIPLTFMPGVIGLMFHEFAVTVVVAVLFSGFISLTLTPMMCARILHRERQKTRLERSASRIINWLLRYYTPALKWCLHHRLVPLCIGVATFFVAVFIFVTTPQDFLPAGDTSIVQGMTLGGEGISPTLMNEYALQASEIARKNPAVKSIIAATNIPNFLAPNEGAFYVNLYPLSQRPPIQQVIEELNSALEEELTGFKVFLKPLPEINLNVGTGMTRANYTYFLSTLEAPEVLYEATGDFLDKLREIPELTDVSTDMQINTPQLTIDILRDRASSYGVTLDTIENALGYAYAEGQLNLFPTQYNVYQVIVQTEDAYKRDPDSLRKIWVAPTADPNSTDLIPLESIVNWRRSTGPLTVNHLNQFLSTTVFFNLAPGAALGAAIAKIDQAADETLPPNVVRQFMGTAQLFSGAMGALALLMIAGIFAIYLILGILYESFLHPITILSALPGALFGAMLMLILFQANLSLYAYIGMIVLVGIVMKNGIMLVEFANEGILNGQPPRDAIVDACLIRFRPILMTTIAAAMGAVPIAIGIGGADAAARRPLGLIILGGLLFAQLITYFFTPVVYLTFERLQERFQTRKKENEL